MTTRDWQEKVGILHLLPPFFITSHHSLCLLCLGEHLRICPQEYTCCSSEVEERLNWDTEATFRGLVEKSGSFLVHTLAALHRKFNGEDLGSPNLATYLPPLCVDDPSKHFVLTSYSISKAPGTAPPTLSSLQGPAPPHSQTAQV